MPRIPTYTAEGNAQGEQLPYGYQIERSLPGGAPGAATAGALHQQGGLLGHIAANLRVQQEELDAVKLSARATQGLAEIHQAVLLDPTLKDEQKMAAFTTRSQALEASLSKETESPAVQRALAGHVARSYAQQAIHLQHNILQNKAQQQVADLRDVSIILGRQAAEGVEPADREQAVKDMGELTARYVGTGLVTPEQGQAFLQNFHEQAAMGQARREIRTDPVAFDPAKYAANVSPAHLIQLGDEATRFLARKDREMIAAQARIDKLDAKAQQDLYGQFLAKAMNQVPGTLAELEARGPLGTNELKAHDYEHVRNILTNPKTEASDPATKSAVINGVAITNPTYTPAQITALNQSGKLNDADARWALEHLQRTEGTQRAQANTVMGHQQAQVERVVNDLLNPGGEGLLGKLDPKAQQLRSQMNTILLNRSAYFGVGKESPVAVMNDALPGLVREFRIDVMKEVTRRSKEMVATGFVSIDQVDAALASGKITKAKHDEIWAKINGFDKAQKRFDELTAQLETQFGKR